MTASVNWLLLLLESVESFLGLFGSDSFENSLLATIILVSISFVLVGLFFILRIMSVLGIHRRGALIFALKHHI